MSMTKESVIQAMSRFQCVIAGGDYPQFNDMCYVEIPGKESSELFFFARKGTDGPGLEDWISRAASPDQASNPATNKAFGVTPVLKPAKQLFALTLASVEVLGHLEALKNADVSFVAFAATPGYHAALEAGKKILADLVAAPGKTLRAKLIALNLAEIKGTPGEMRFLTQILKFDVQQFAPKQAVAENEDADLRKAIALSLGQAVDAPKKPAMDPVSAEIYRTREPVQLPTIREQNYWKDRVTAEVLSPEYIGRGYPLGRRSENRYEQRAMEYIQKIYDVKILTELLGIVLSHATARKNVACIISELVSKIVGIYYKDEVHRAQNVPFVYNAIDHLILIMRKIPLWSETKEDSLRPYVQGIEQLFTCIPDDQQRHGQLFVEIHKFRSEMLNRHPNMSEKLKDFLKFCNFMSSNIFCEKLKGAPQHLLMTVVSNLMLVPAHPSDEMGRTRNDALKSRIIDQNALMDRVAILRNALPAQSAPVALAPVPLARQSSNAAMILGFIDQIESAVQSGDKSIVELGAIMTEIAQQDTQCNKVELTFMLGRLKQIKTTCRTSQAVRPAVVASVLNAIKPCKTVLKDKLRM